jgi:phospho-N-acetylmuramoyl-pentapeptide-transferase
VIELFLPPGTSLDAPGLTALRAAMAALTGFLVVIASGRWFVPFVAACRFHDAAEKGDSEELDRIHAHKRSTPTLGGVLIVAGTAAATLAWTRTGERLVLILLGYTLLLAAVGFADDWKKLRTRRKGISARTKLAAQVGISSLALALVLVDPPAVTSPTGEVLPATTLFIPLPGIGPLDLGPFYPMLGLLVLAGTSNAVNLTDGLDGLAAGCSALVAGALAAAALLGSGAAGLLHIPAVAGGSEVAVFLCALLGAVLGFLRFNAHPARIFMGDTGSLAIGGAIGLAAILLELEVVLVVAGGVLVAEAGSVILQVLSFKTLRKRIFLIAPLHHHFQFKGWPETKVTARFWIAGAVCALASLAFLAVHTLGTRP